VVVNGSWRSVAMVSTALDLGSKNSNVRETRKNLTVNINILSKRRSLIARIKKKKTKNSSRVINKRQKRGMVSAYRHGSRAAKIS